MQDEPEELVATLVEPGSYVRRLNQVASLTTEHVVYVARKFVSRQGWEVVRYPVAQCARVTYAGERSIWTFVSGGLLVALIGFIALILVLYWNELEPGTRVPVGAILFAGLYGLRRLSGARRHRLRFTMRDGTRLEWRSRPGEYESHKANAGRVVEFARSRGILEESRLARE